MPEHVLFIVTPLVAGILIRLVRRPRLAPADLVRTICDLLTLRMILRDTAPDERVALVAAHRDWRGPSAATRSPRPRHTAPRGPR